MKLRKKWKNFMKMQNFYNVHEKSNALEFI